VNADGMDSLHGRVVVVTRISEWRHEQTAQRAAKG